MKKVIAIIITVLCLCAGCGAVLQLTNTVDFTQYLAFNKDTEEETAAFYVSFMDDYFVMDIDGVVIKCTATEPDDIPEIENMMFNSFIVGQSADAESESTFEYVKEVCQLLEVYSISASALSISGDEITLNLDENFSVKLGEDEDTDVKIKDLQSLYSKLYEYEGGVLYMTSADTNGQGYTFKEVETEEDDESTDEESADEQEGAS